MKEIRIHTLGNNNLFKCVAANYLGVNPEVGRKKLCKLLKERNITLIVANIFEDWKSYPDETFKFQSRRAFDIGLHQLRMLRRYSVHIEFENSQSIEVDKNILKSVSPPLYEYYFKQIITKE